MSDFEKFSQYWEQAVNGLTYRIDTASSPVLTRNQIQNFWREELMDKRFFSSGLKHGARVFLDELAQRRPETAEAVQTQLRASVMPLGAEGFAVAGSACVAAAGLAFANMDKLHAVTKLASLAVGSTFAVKTAQGAAQGGKSRMLENLEKESAQQLAVYKVLLESSAQ